MNQNELTSQIECLRDRLTSLERQVSELPQTQPQSELLTQALEELQTALAELCVAHEELEVSHEALDAERRRYQELFEFAPDGYLVTDQQGIIQEANRSATELLNTTSEYLLGKPLAVFVVLEERQVFRTQLAQVHQAEKLQEWEVRLKPCKRVPFYAALRVNAIRNEIGQIIALRWLVRDISDRKQAERALQETQNFFTKLLEYTPAPIYIISTDQRFCLVNSAWEQYVGRKRHEVIGQRLEQIFAPKLAQQFQKVNQQVIDTEQPVMLEDFVYAPDRRLVFYTVKFPLHNSQGRVEAIGGISIDITKYKQAEEELYRQEQTLKALMQNSPDMTSRLDRELRYLYASPAIQQVTGLSPQAFIGRTNEELGMPEEKCIYWRTIFKQVVMTGQPVIIEFDYPTPDDGGMKYYQSRIVPEFAVDGSIESVLCVSHDITERKRVEEALRESEELFRFTFEQVAVGMVQTTLDGRYIRVNQKFCDIVGYTREELLSLTFLDITHPDDQPVSLEYLSLSLAGQVSTFSEEKRFVCKDGSILWVHTTASILRGHSGEPKCRLAVIEDISQRKQTEEILSQRQQEFEALVENSPDIVARVDRNLRYVFVNRAIEQATGMSPQDILGKTNRELGTSEEEARAWDKRVQRIFSTGEPVSIEFDFLSPSGTRYYQSLMTPEFAKDGSVVSILMITRDITEQKQAEKKIQASLKEKELLLQEIHHRVKNNLQIISSLVYLQARRTEDMQARGILQDSQNRIASMALVHESLYSSQDFSQVNFAEYIQKLADNLFRVYKIQTEAISLRVNVNAKLLVGLDKAIPCGLILNELMTNALKHGFLDCKTGEIFVSLDMASDTEIVLIVGDSGNSLPPNFNIKNNQSMGLKLVTTLIKQLQGNLEIERSNGSIFKIVFPSV